jgi:hypothetical protein
VNDESRLDEATNLIRNAYAFEAEPTVPPPLLVERIATAPASSLGIGSQA